MRRSEKLTGGEGTQEFDDRVPRSGKFVEQLRGSKELADRLPGMILLKGVMGRVVGFFGISPGVLSQGARNQAVAGVRAVISFLAVREMGYNEVELARIFRVSRAGISIVADRGKEIVRQNKPVRTLFR